MFMLYCSDPLHPRQPDEAYAAAISAAQAVGADYALIDFESLVPDDNPWRAIRRVEAPEAPVSAIYCGWMLTPTQYHRLFDALAERDIHLINDPAAYLHVHYLPENDEGTYQGAAPPFGLFREVARTVRSRFFRMDVARCLDGEWIIIELGDGQVAGLPESAKAPEFYAALKAHWPAGADWTVPEAGISVDKELRVADRSAGRICKWAGNL